MGIPGDYENPRLEEVYRKTIAACNKHGKWVGCGGLHSRMDLVEKFCGMGVRWVMAATDGPLLLAGATKRASEMSALSQRVCSSNAGKKTNGMKGANGVNGRVANGLKTAPSVEVQEIPSENGVAR